MVDQGHVDLVRAVRAGVRIPIAVKIGPQYSAPVHFARSLVDAGATAIVIFNRFYQPDFNLETLDVVPSLTLSSSEELRLRLLWAGILHSRVRADIAITGGIHTAEDVLKAMMAGARISMMASALFLHGIDHIARVLENLKRWMTAHEYHSIQQMQGSMSQRAVADPSLFERGNYMRVLHSYPRQIPREAR
jgi:dihydroorotate dehydrogenase (fumarate)